MTAPDGQMFAGCFNRAANRNADSIPCVWLWKKSCEPKGATPVGSPSPILGPY